MKLQIIIVAALCAFLVGCSATAVKLTDIGATQSDVQSVSEANNQFAFELYDELGQGNLFFSPYSISTALAMTYEGARGQTAAEMQNVLHYPKDSARHLGFARLHNLLNIDTDYKLHTANALWAQENYPFTEEFLNTNKLYYGARVENANFKDNAPEVAKEINSWVEKQTHDKIKDILNPGDLSSMTRLVLVNAIYFKGDWKETFKKSNTYDAKFKTPSGDKTVNMMLLKDEHFNYYGDEEVQVLEMPYKGKELSMFVVLPRDNLASINLTQENYAEWKSQMQSRKIPVHFPRFEFDTKYGLNKHLQTLGMKEAFGESADFSGMDGTDRLFINKVIHQAYIKVDEKGTEAAAATVVSMAMITSVGPPSEIFKADHPFVFFIEHKESGAILFMGRVDDPTKQ